MRQGVWLLRSIPALASRIDHYARRGVKSSLGVPRESSSIMDGKRVCRISHLNPSVSVCHKASTALRRNGSAGPRPFGTISITTAKRAFSSNESICR